MSASLCTLKDGMSYTKQLPSKGLSHNQVLEKIKEYKTLSKCSFTWEVSYLFNYLYYHFEIRRSRLHMPMLGFIAEKKSFILYNTVEKTCDF